MVPTEQSPQMPAQHVRTARPLGTRAAPALQDELSDPGSGLGAWR